MSNEKMINIIKNSVREYDSQARIILYGSRARGNGRADSDWDIIVIVNNNKTPAENYRMIAYPLFEKGMELGAEINAIVYSKEQWENGKPTLFKHNVMNEGIEL